MDIHILAPEVVDQIAAGEVVERPAHLVKELVENALDANASEVDIQVEQGGRWVKIKDNGSGMNRRNLPLSVARHGTSKIQNSTDLWKLQSYGFRGEALASIASVSRITITSQVAGETGHRLVCEFGKSSDPEPIGAEPGTTILVEDLFANVPARLKFLKGDSAEITQVKNVVRALALSYPKVTMRFRTAGKLVFMWPGVDSLKARAEQVLEHRPMFYGTAEVEGIRAEVAVCAPNVTTGNSRQIWMFAQNRWVQDRSLQAAVLDAFRGLLMHGEFPIGVVTLMCPPDEIDVNIHPTKSQVKFLKAAQAFRAVNRAVRDVLEKAEWVAHDIGHSQKSNPAPDLSLSFAPTAENSERFQCFDFERTQYQKKSFHSPLESEMSVMETLRTYSPTATRQFKEDTELDRHLNDSQQTPTVAPSPQLTRHWSTLQILGQTNLTYIVAQNDRSLILVDQHAAHERVAYETLMQAWSGGKIDIQQFLLPLTLDMSEEQVEALVHQQNDVEKLGVTLEMLSPTTIAVNAAPTLLSEAALQQALTRLADEVVDAGGSFALEKVIGDICATLACHSVVRAGQPLSTEQMRSLLEQMDEFALSSFCPHGRPVYVEYPFATIEKSFGRIV
jgi:DNA mismatch repair protein MutL